ncbi:hypothetical protein EOPP23_14005 [Endozoicomonas sp. OPT23]|uniref:hypothetical protein n=1 Tax=Endozoicomonas sp. OPT23 TaxID=2072845 RepID=UPI00129B7046|nr:hypothetical protein [Endozoicomonas sp. OPT23]MRI34105.1 hypothetical protein [Endozoicomonas sp. OPT23]
MNLTRITTNSFVFAILALSPTIDALEFTCPNFESISLSRDSATGLWSGLYETAPNDEEPTLVAKISIPFKEDYLTLKKLNISEQQLANPFEESKLKFKSMITTPKTTRAFSYNHFITCRYNALTNEKLEVDLNIDSISLKESPEVNLILHPRGPSGGKTTPNDENYEEIHCHDQTMCRMIPHRFSWYFSRDDACLEKSQNGVDCLKNDSYLTLPYKIRGRSFGSYIQYFYFDYITADFQIPEGISDADPILSYDCDTENCQEENHHTAYTSKHAPLSIAVNSSAMDFISYLSSTGNSKEPCKNMDSYTVCDCHHLENIYQKKWGWIILDMKQTSELGSELKCQILHSNN